jgi:hypothetical protein
MTQARSNPALTAHRLRELLSYNQETGVFTWRVSRGGVSAGAQANSKDHRGYMRVRIAGVDYATHRLAWLYVTGSWPDHEIDHINKIKTDNRFANLRDVTATINMQNQIAAMTHGKSGFLGVTWHKNGQRWQAQIKVSGKNIHLGLFSTAEDAHGAYLSAKRALHEGCTI